MRGLVLPGERTGKGGKPISNQILLSLGEREFEANPTPVEAGNAQAPRCASRKQSQDRRRVFSRRRTDFTRNRQF